MDAMEVIQTIAETIPSIDDSKVLGELADYRSNESIFAKPFVWKSAQQTTPTSWWNGICRSTQLSRVAANILSLPPTSAAIERSFSRHSWIHSAKRNRLTSIRASKIVFIAHNLALNEHDAQQRTNTLVELARPASNKDGHDEEDPDVFHSEAESSDTDLSLQNSSDEVFNV